MDTRLRRAGSAAGRLVIGLTLQDIDDLAGHLAAETNHSNDAGMCRVFDGLLARLTALEEQYTDSRQSVSAATTTRPSFTAKQGQSLAFLHCYTKIHGQAPAEADFARYFRVTPPAVHAMILALERAGRVERTPGQARSLRLRIPRADLPDLA